MKWAAGRRYRIVLGIRNMVMGYKKPNLPRRSIRFVKIRNCLRNQVEGFACSKTNTNLMQLRGCRGISSLNYTYIIIKFILT